MMPRQTRSGVRPANCQVWGGWTCGRSRLPQRQPAGSMPAWPHRCHAMLVMLLPGVAMPCEATPSYAAAHCGLLSLVTAAHARPVRAKGWLARMPGHATLEACICMLELFAMPRHVWLTGTAVLRCYGMAGVAPTSCLCRQACSSVAVLPSPCWLQGAVPIPGAKDMAQAKENLGALGWRLRWACLPGKREAAAATHCGCR